MPWPLLFALLAGCVTIGHRYARTVPVPLPPGAPGTSHRHNMAFIKIKDLHLDVVTWDAVHPGRAAPPLVLFLRVHPHKVGFAFDPMQVMLDIPGRAPVHPSRFAGPGSTAYQGFGVDSCGGPSFMVRTEAAFVPLATKSVCFLLSFETAVTGPEPAELRVDGLTWSGHPVDVPRVQLSQSEGHVISVPSNSVDFPGLGLQR